MSSSLYAAELKCQEYEIKYVFAKKIKKERKEYCVNFKMGTLYSKNCQQAQCVPQTSNQIELKKGYKKGIGTLGFHICHKLSGKPQIIKIQKPNKKWQTFDRCRLEKGTIDTVSLLVKLGIN